MLRIFLDSSVLFSAIYSNHGHARDLILLAEQKKILLVISKYVMAEVKKNLKNKAGELIGLLDLFIEAASIKVIADPPKKLIREVGLFVHSKDAPVVAAAISQKVDYLVSFDRKDLVENGLVKKHSKVRIVFPKEVVRKFAP